MRTRGINVQQIVLAAALLAALLWNLAQAAEIRAVDLQTGPTGTRAELRVDREAEYRLISLANPDRLVVDLPASRAAGKLALPAPAGVVKTIRSGQPEPGTLRIVFDLSEPVAALKPRYEAGPEGTRLVIEWPGDGQADPIARIAAASAGVTKQTAGSSAAAHRVAAQRRDVMPSHASGCPQAPPTPISVAVMSTARGPAPPGTPRWRWGAPAGPGPRRP